MAAGISHQRRVDAVANSPLLSQSPRVSAAIAMCPRCRDERFVCEQHPTQPWPHDDCAGPGVPCPLCNAGDRPDLPDGFKVIATTREE